MFSCNYKSDHLDIRESKDIVNVEIKEYPFDSGENIDSEKYFDSVKYVYLEDIEESVIAEVQEIFFVDSLIIVASRGVSSILFFDINGNYLHKINKRGRGHGEYLTQAKVMVDEERKMVMVYDHDTNKILYYNFNGNYIKTISNFCDGALARDIINLPNGSFLCYNECFADEYPSGLWQVDSTGKFDKYIYRETKDYPLDSEQGLTHLEILDEGIIGFFDSNTMSTYHIINDTIYCRSRYKMPDKTRADYAGMKKTENGYNKVFNYKEKGNYIFLVWGAPNWKLFQSVIRKSDNAIETGLLFTPIVNKYTLINGMGTIRNNRPNILTSEISVDYFKEIKENISDEELRSRVIKVLDAAPPTTKTIIEITYVKK